MAEQESTLRQYTNRAQRLAQAAEAQLRRRALIQQLADAPLLTLPEAAEVLGQISLATMRAWIATGRVRTLKIGGRRFIRIDEIRRLRGETES